MTQIKVDVRNTYNGGEVVCMCVYIFELSILLSRSMWCKITDITNKLLIYFNSCALMPFEFNISQIATI